MSGWSAWEKRLFVAFLFWGIAGLIFTGLRLTPEAIAGTSLPAALRDFVAGCLRFGDPILILLAFTNTHLLAARHWGASAARRWVIIVLIFSLAVETLGTITGFPFGAYHYTDRFGPRLGPVPLTIPLAWYMVVTNALFLARTLARGRPASMAMLAAALISTAYDYVLEPFATTVRGYWLWQGGAVPVENYVAWFVLSGVLVSLFAPAARRIGPPRDIRPAAILGLTLLIFVLGTVLD